MEFPVLCAKHAFSQLRHTTRKVAQPSIARLCLRYLSTRRSPKRNIATNITTETSFVERIEQSLEANIIAKAKYEQVAGTSSVVELVENSLNSVHSYAQAAIIQPYTESPSIPKGKSKKKSSKKKAAVVAADEEELETTPKKKKKNSKSKKMVNEEEVAETITEDEPEQEVGLLSSRLLDHEATPSKEDLMKMFALKERVTGKEAFSRPCKLHILDDALAERMAKHMGDLKDITVIHVNPGPGVMLKTFLDKTDAKKVIAYEDSKVFEDNLKS
eukprot:Colp12_sorted_trinity150504_noHs@16269